MPIELWVLLNELIIAGQHERLAKHTCNSQKPNNLRGMRD